MDVASSEPLINRFVSIGVYVIVVCSSISLFHCPNKLCGTIIRFVEDASDNGWISCEKKNFVEWFVSSDVILGNAFDCVAKYDNILSVLPVPDGSPTIPILPLITWLFTT